MALLRKETCNRARDKRRGFSHAAAALHRGRTRAPADGASELSFPIFFLEIGRLRRAISNWTSPRDVQLQIASLLPSSCLDLRSEIRRLPNETSDLKLDIEVQSDIEVRFQKEETSDLKKSGKHKGKTLKGLAKIRRACGPTPVACGWLWG